MSPLIIDAGVIIASMLPDEPLSAQAIYLLSRYQPTVPLHAPLLLRYEVSAVLRKAVYTKRISHVQGAALLNILLKRLIVYHDDTALHEQAFALAEQFNRPRTYDAQYLALSERLGGEFWTTDERLVNGVLPTFTAARWIGGLTPA